MLSWMLLGLAGGLLWDFDGGTTELDEDALHAFGFDGRAGFALDHDRRGRRRVVVFPAVVAALRHHLTVHENVHFVQVRRYFSKRELARRDELGGERDQRVAEVVGVGHLIVLRGRVRRRRATALGQHV